MTEAQCTPPLLPPPSPSLWMRTQRKSKVLRRAPMRVFPLMYMNVDLCPPPKVREEGGKRAPKSTPKHTRAKKQRAKRRARHLQKAPPPCSCFFFFFFFLSLCVAAVVRLFHLSAVSLLFCSFSPTPSFCVALDVGNHWSCVVRRSECSAHPFVLWPR